MCPVPQSMCPVRPRGLTVSRCRTQHHDGTGHISSLIPTLCTLLHIITNTLLEINTLLGVVR